ncbi:MAG: hypothetical protein LIP01_05860 [Tannerellaceae bacterium]|nr:hypothetical protein [Tannerellaceae bacterium]
MENKNRFKQILEKLETAKKKELSVFGSKAHVFKLNSPIPLAEIEAFEKNIPLPYRKNTAIFCYMPGTVEQVLITAFIRWSNGMISTAGLINYPTIS